MVIKVRQRKGQFLLIFAIVLLLCSLTLHRAVMMFEPVEITATEAELDAIKVMTKNALARALSDEIRGISDFHTVLRQCIGKIRRERPVLIEILDADTVVSPGSASASGTFHISYPLLEREIVERFTVKLVLEIKEVTVEVLGRIKRITISVFIADELGGLPHVSFKFYYFDETWEEFQVEPINHLNGTFAFSCFLPLSATKVRIVVHDMRCIQVERIVPI